MTFQTEQEHFWAGSFGDEYTRRNAGELWVASNIAMFSTVLRNTKNIQSVIEFGANAGLNLQALHTLLPDASLTGVEINAAATKKLSSLGYVETLRESFLTFEDERVFDLVLTKGVLIHINPEYLDRCYSILYKNSGKYICIAEYYSPRPTELHYRGHEQKLFKRDFAGELMARHTDLELVDYGFVYHGAKFPQDDLNWFLLEKPSV